MRLIVITTPSFQLPVTNEASIIARLLSAGIDTIHLRKPGSTFEQCASLLDAIPQEYHCRIVTHDHFSLCERYNLKGIHLNRRNPKSPEGFKGSVSCSCHSLEEVVQNKPKTDYVFLSPIFDSISKQGYSSAFSPQVLIDAAEKGVIDNKVIALGGITAEHISKLQAWHFGGASLLGDVWNKVEGMEFDEYLSKLLAAKTPPSAI